MRAYVCGTDESADKPDSVPLTRYQPSGGDHLSRTSVTAGLKQPTRTLGRAALERVLLGFAPGGVYLAGNVTTAAGGLLHHPFTLTTRRSRGGLLLGFAPGGVYLAGNVTTAAGGLLHHPFTLTTRRSRGGLLSVALSRGSPRVAVSHHLALRSPDGPRALSCPRPPG